MRTARAVVLLLATLALAPPAAAGADDPARESPRTSAARPFGGAPRPAIAAARAEAPIRVDGVLDEADWARAEPATDFRRFEIREGELPSESTEVRVLFDDERLVVGIRCTSRGPGAIRSSLAPRDQCLEDDLVAIHLDTYLDRRRGYLFGVNPHGVQVDGILVGGDPDFSWDAVWDAETVRGDDGWTAEIAVPFRSLRFPADGAGTWGLWVRRQITKHDEVCTWPAFRLAVRGDVMVQAGDLTGLAGVRGGGRMDLQPYAASARSESRANAPPSGDWSGGSDHDVGLDVRYAVTSTMNLNVAVNPDFSQVEADALQIDRNQRFPLFFPEKRPFFVEGGEIFTVGLNLPYRLVYTRRIADPLAGAKLTGQLGRVRLGAIAAWDEGGGSLAGVGAGDVEGPSHEGGIGIGRITYDVGEHSRVGLLATWRGARAEPPIDPLPALLPAPVHFRRSSNALAGLDADLRLTRALNFHGVAALTDHRADSTNGTRRTLTDGFYSLFLYYNDGTRQGGVWDDYVGPDFRMETGFLERVNFRESGAFANWTVRRETPWLRTWEPFVDTRVIHAPGGALVEWNSTQGLRAAFQGQTSAELAYVRRRQDWAGESFDLDAASLKVANTQWRALAVAFEMRLGDDLLYGADAASTFMGWSERYALSATARPSPRLTSEIELERNRFGPGFAAGEVFDVWVVGAKTTYQFTRRLYTRVFPQYDADARRLDADALLGYVLHPGSVLYLGVGGDFEDVAGRRRATRRSVFVKASYRFRV